MNKPGAVNEKILKFFIVINFLSNYFFMSWTNLEQSLWPNPQNMALYIYFKTKNDTWPMVYMFYSNFFYILWSFAFYLQEDFYVFAMILTLFYTSVLYWYLFYFMLITFFSIKLPKEKLYAWAITICTGCSSVQFFFFFCHLRYTMPFHWSPFSSLITS